MLTSPETETVIRIPLEQLHESPSNPNKHFKAPKADFIASVKELGVLQPIIVRGRKKGGHEIIFGHRRWRAAKLAEQGDVPAIVRDVSDDNALEMQVVENSQRQDTHPVDEADSFAELQRRGYTIERLAERIGRPVRYVRERLELVKLHPKARAALDEERIHIGHALLLCRIPEKLQPQALEDMVNKHENTTLSVEASGELVRSTYMLKLATAPFDRGNADLVPKAGACLTCPKRSGNQGELFADVKSPDVCTDPVCFRAKLDAHWNGVQKTAKAEGVAIVPAKEVTFWEHSNHSQSNKWERLDNTRYVGSSSVKITTLVGKDLKPALARNPHTGAIVEMVPRSVVDKAAKSYQAKKAAKKRGSSPAREKVSPAEKARREKQRLEGQSRERIAAKTLAAIVSGCEATVSRSPVFVDVLRVAVHLAVRSSYGAESAIEARRSGVADDESAASTRKAVAAFERRVAETKEPAQLLGLLLEVLLTDVLEYPSAEDEKRLSGLCKALGVDRAKLRTAAVAELKNERALEKSGKKAPTSGTCRVCGCTDEWGCDGGCEWVDDAHTLCSNCEDAEPAGKKSKPKKPAKSAGAKPAGAKPKAAKGGKKSKVSKKRGRS